MVCQVTEVCGVTKHRLNTQGLQVLNQTVAQVRLKSGKAPSLPRCESISAESWSMTQRLATHPVQLVCPQLATKSALKPLCLGIESLVLESQVSDFPRRETY